MGWYLLAIAILSPKPVTVEGAEDLWYKDGFRLETIKSTGEEMHCMKETGMTYREIGALYGINADTCYNRIRRFLGKI